ncbi:hypothetical protein JTE90_007007 [Oedothorax gibbosus]|uniref:4Fe-4S ferredoxin-type domain-containing protein n=1 Tax=Oedothorax gibbosus TaxID=931172 RepID=A0AAV6TVC9_9ARAC|nr:hypothetical protein JTE90_007007 [Oedothorax gibbosus]
MFSALEKNVEDAWDQFFDFANVYRKECVDDIIFTVPIEENVRRTHGYMKKFATTALENKKNITFERTCFGCNTTCPARTVFPLQSSKLAQEKTKAGCNTTCPTRTVFPLQSSKLAQEKIKAGL